MPVDDSPDISVDANAQDIQKTEQVVSEVLFVDANVENYQSLIDNLQRNVEVVLIAADENGIGKITSY